MLLSLVLALTFLSPCPGLARTQAAQASAPGQRLDIDAALRERGVEVEFTGNRVFTRRDLLDMLSEDGSVADWFVKGGAAEKLSGDDENSAMLEASLHQLANLLRARGHLRATVGSKPEVEATAAGRRLSIAVNEGPLYRVGKVEFRGSKVISPERLAEMFPLKTGEVADARLLYTFLFEKLKRHYGDRGYIRYEADVEPTFRAEPGAREGVADFQIEVAEGDCFTIHSVEFEGNARTPDGQLRPLLLMRAGETYRQARLDESLKKLEATGLFERIDRDRDVDYQMNEQRAEVKLRIRLKEKSTP